MEKLMTHDASNYLKLFKSEKYSELISQITENYNLISNDANILNVLGAAHLKLCQYTEAERQFEKALTFLPNSKQLLNNLGLSQKGQKNWSKATATFNKLITLHPEFNDAKVNLGLTYMESGIHSDDKETLKTAIEQLLVALNADSDNITLLNNIGTIYNKLQNHSNAITYYQKAINLNPKFSQAYFNIGNAHYAQGNVEQALEFYSAALQIKPTLSNALRKLAAIHYSLGNEEECYEYLSRLSLCNEGSSLRDQFRLLPWYVMNLRNEKKRNKNVEDELTTDFPITFDLQFSNELIPTLYTLDMQNMNDTKDARFGEGVCSKDFDLFSLDHPEIRSISATLLEEIEIRLKKKVLFCESFLNILRGDGGSNRHSHVAEKDADFDLWQSKYSLVFYLDVGDQSGKKPGFLKVYEPDIEILPYNGMCILMPASRDHSAVYDGETDRVMIGINAYCV